MNNNIDPTMPMPPNRGGVPSRSVNDLQQINTIQDPGMQSAQQAAAYEKFNNIAQYTPPPTMKTEGEEDEPKASVKAMEVNQVSNTRTEVQPEGNEDVKQRTARLGGSF